MAQQEELGRFLVGFATEISVNVTAGFHEVGKSFSTQLANLSTIISPQGVSQIVGAFEGEPSSFRDWIKSIGKYILLAGGNDIQSWRLAYQTSRGAVSDYIQRYMTENLNSSWADLKSELNVRFAEVNDSHHAFTMLHKARQSKNETSDLFRKVIYLS